MNGKRAAAAMFVALAAATVAGCASEDGEGTLNVTVYGEEFIEAGIPADVFVDGWAVVFDRFVVTLGAVTAARGEGAPDLSEPADQAFDLTQASDGAGQAVASGVVPAGRYDHVAFRIAPPVAGGAAIAIEGSATRDAVTKTFAWAFTTATDYGECESTAQVTDGGEATSQITVHADHLFYDDLFSPTPNVAFDLVAGADTDDDGAITSEELGAVDITAEKRYQVGSTGIDNLLDFIAYQTSTVGHIDGEGHCHATSTE